MYMPCKINAPHDYLQKRGRGSLKEWPADTSEGPSSSHIGAIMPSTLSPVCPVMMQMLLKFRKKPKLIIDDTKSGLLGEN